MSELASARQKITDDAHEWSNQDRVHIEVDLTKAEYAALMAALSPPRREGFRHVRTLDECEVIVTHPDYHPVIVNMATFEVTRLWDDEQQKREDRE
jgi:hypothetical protein